jgi:serine/threonine protein kinase
MIELLKSCFNPSVRGYTIHEKIGDGSYGEVYRISRGPKIFALKRIDLMETYDDIIRTLREVRVLKYLSSCPQSVMLIDGWMDKKGTRTNLVLEYFDYDLRKVVKEGFEFSETHLRYIARQIFVGLAFLHSSGIIHRDVKTANILINSKDCRTVLCDYNLAACTESSDVYSPRTQNVVTRWYRSPELLQGRPYSSKIDVWAAGCVLFELATSKVLWCGHTDEDQLRRICSTLKPSYEDREEMGLDTFLFSETGDSRVTFDRFSERFSDEFNDFMKTILAFSPCRRSSAVDALNHSWLSAISEPRLILSDNLLKSSETSERTVTYILASEVINISRQSNGKRTI